ncbi:MAG: tetratricopeptide repeat protein [Synechococcales bacterium]|nr:tetratricopeptide repeat protein [Synechococcales bacterium]
MINATLNQAIQACEAALQQRLQQPSGTAPQTEFAIACRTLGNLLQGIGRFEEALNWHSRAVEPSPSAAAVYASFGRLYILQEQWQEACRAFQQTVQHDATYTEAYWKLAALANQMNQRQEALLYWFKALSLEPHKATAAGHRKLGDALLADHKPGRATLCYQRALQTNPNDELAYQGLGRSLEQQGHWQQAIGVYRRAIRQLKRPDRPLGWAYDAIGSVKVKQGRPAEAITLFRQAMQLDPTYPWSYHNLANVLLEQGKWQAAIQVVQQAIAQNPDYPWAYSQLGRARMALGDRAGAIAAHQTASALRGWQACRDRNYEFSQDWFTHNIPIWQQHLQPLCHQPHVRVLEIGSYQGMSACWLLDQVLTHPSARLVCIDPNFQPEFDRNLAKTAGATKVIKRVGHSHAVLPTLARGTFDLIYIDGCHLADHVRKDGLLSLPLLKPGGFLIFDDYWWTDPAYPGQDPKRGIDAVLRQAQAQLDVRHRGYQIIAQKRP